MMAAQALNAAGPCACSSSSNTRLGAAARAPAAARPRPAAAFLWQQPRSGRLAARRQQTCVRAVLSVAEDTWEQEVLKSDVPVLVDFWATWCGPCKLVAPTMDWCEKEYAGRLKVVKVEADPNPKLVEQYKVYGLPCLLVIKDGQVVEGSHNEGAVTRKWVIDYLEKHGVPAVVPSA